MQRLDLSEVLTAIITRAAHLVGTEHGFLYLVNREEQVLETSVGIGVHAGHRPFRLRYGEGVAGHVWRTGQPILVPDYASWPGRATGVGNINFHAVVAVPLSVENEVVGVIGLSFDTPGYTPDAETVDMLTRFAQLAALALDNARLYTAAQQELAERRQTEQALRASEREIRDLYATAQRQARELELLGQVRAAIARQFDLPSLFRTVVESVAQTFGYTHVSIYRLEGYTLVLQHQVGYDRVIERVPITCGVSGKAVRTRRPILVEDARNESCFLHAIEGITSEICVPLLNSQQVLGTLNVETIGDVRLGPADLRLICALAEQVSIAISRAQLFEAERRRTRELEALRATMTEISANLDLDTLLKAIIERQVKLLGATSGELSLYDKQRGDLQVVMSYNMGRDYSNTRLALGEGLMGQVALTRAPLIVSNYREWPGRSPQYEDSAPVSCVAMPLLAGDELIGVLSVSDLNVNRIFDQDDVRLLSLFAQQATVAIQNARLFAEVRALAVTDPLTGLANRRHFFTLAQQEMERAQRYGRPLAVLLLDIDDFKQINDTYGHAVGDRVLETVGAYCRSSLRAADMVARYGGEEIVALLPETDARAAEEAAERLRAGIATLDFGPELPCVTASIGVAVYDHADECDVSTLIDRADRALYAAKRGGKDRVALWAGGALEAPHDVLRSSALKLR